jgi:hypothetical protein
MMEVQVKHGKVSPHNVHTTMKYRERDPEKYIYYNMNVGDCWRHKTSKNFPDSFSKTNCSIIKM